MEKAVADCLMQIVGEPNVITDRKRMQNYLFDETPQLMRPQPANDLVLVKPGGADEISQILKLANSHKLPVFLRGGGTGLVGGAVPVDDGIILALERMDKLEIDDENLMAIAEAGVTLDRLLSAVSDMNLSFPLHPGDETAQIGGLTATNAGGARAIRHGVMRNHVRGIEAVLPTGEFITLGGKLQKNNVGYDVMDLIVGSEGTLAVITKVILRLYPKADVTATLIVPYEHRHDALKSVPLILKDGIMPMAIEYFEKDLIEKAAGHTGQTWPVKDGNCYLMVIESEKNRDELLSESVRIAEICKNNGALEPLLAEPVDEQEKLLRVRSSIYSVLKPDTIDILDTTVPPSNIGRMFDSVDEIAQRHNVWLPAYGHAGDGNVHIHIMKEEGKPLDFVKELRMDIYNAAVELEGVITGEHGIGRTRLESMGGSISDSALNLMRKIKRLFDPNNILNPKVKIPL